MNVALNRRFASGGNVGGAVVVDGGSVTGAVVFGAAVVVFGATVVVFGAAVVVLGAGVVAGKVVVGGGTLVIGAAVGSNAVHRSCKIPNATHSSDGTAAKARAAAMLPLPVKWNVTSIGPGGAAVVDGAGACVAVGGGDGGTGVGHHGGGACVTGCGGEDGVAVLGATVVGAAVVVTTEITGLTSAKPSPSNQADKRPPRSGNAVADTLAVNS
mmetsp:Transcript_29532/g.91243  ORF Transcript_29532/g.91243 Transcript_29532/m.91243 type:complete len:213 (+) Transcript_29532:296-934(+)